MAFVRGEYDEHYKRSNLPDHFRDGPEFLIGGVGQSDKFPCSYRVRVKENDVRGEFEHGECGLCWNAQSDAIERLMRGCDRKLRSIIEVTVFYGSQSLSGRNEQSGSTNS